MEEWPGQYVRIMAEYCSEGVWDSDGCAGTVDELPLPPDLQADIRAWAFWYDRDSLDNPIFPVAEFATQGLALARRVKAELSAWIVVYFDEEKFAAAPEGADRIVFEYEIK